MLYNPKLEIAILKWEALFVGLNSLKICFMPAFIFPTFICFPLAKSWGLGLLLESKNRLPELSLGENTPCFK